MQEKDIQGNIPKDRLRLLINKLIPHKPSSKSTTESEATDQLCMRLKEFRAKFALSLPTQIKNRKKMEELSLDESSMTVVQECISAEIKHAVLERDFDWVQGLVLADINPIAILKSWELREETSRKTREANSSQDAEGKS